MKNKPFKYSEWIKHAYDFEEGVSSIEHVGNEALVIAHPAHPKVSLDLEGDVVAQVYALPKSLQLYFFGLVWVGFCNLEDDAEWGVVKRILLSLFDYAKSNPKLDKKEMVWDDHALSERACVLIYLKETLGREDVLRDIDEHLMILIKNLDIILDSVKWEGNNHRVFHLCAKWCIEKHLLNDDASAQIYLDKLQDFFLTLIDVDTGLSVEQSVSYYNFDLILLKMVSNFIGTEGEKFRDARLDFRLIENKKNMHIKALAFPDGQLPATGDTPLGICIPPPSLENNERARLWKGLEKMGHFRGCSKNEKFHYHILSHNAEAAHGHHSPLHLDLWVKGIGTVLVDSGGPYKYGDSLRYEWFRDYKSHNTVSFFQNNDFPKSSVKVSNVGEFLEGEFVSGDSRLARKVIVENENVRVVDKVLSYNDWVLSLHFDPSLQVVRVENYFFIKKNQYSIKLFIDAGEYAEFKLGKGYVTKRGGHKEHAACIFIFGSAGSFEVTSDYLLLANEEVVS